MSSRRGVWVGTAGYLALLAASHLVGPPALPELRAGEQRIELAAVGQRAEGADSVELAVRELGPAEAPVVVLVHGSPGNLQNFDEFAEKLAIRYRVLVPDLPGFGRSTRRIPDYSMRAHAQYLLALLGQLSIERAHLVGFSMGGGVALNAAKQAPDRIASLSMIASIGVQEHELLGNYTLNHLIHGFQLGGIWLLENAVPHFGLLHRNPLNTAYARNFYDSDQRPLREILQQLTAPLLVIHGKEDFLVPFAAAEEHHRLAPHSELEVLDAGHLILFQNRDRVAERTLTFLDAVEAGQALTRDAATPERIAAAAQAFDASASGPRDFLGIVVFAFLVLVASLISEDLTCIGVGLLVGSGQLGFGSGAIAATFALWIGDLMLYAAGRWLGPPLLRLTPWRRLASDRNLERGARKLEAGGAWVFFASRFVPGARLPTYVAAGATRYPFAPCAAYLFAAAVVWAPLLVGVAALLGSLAFRYLELLDRYALAGLIALALAVFGIVRVAIPLCSYRGRRLLLGSWRRLTRWEFWPMWLFYPPVILWILYLGIRHRGLTLLSVVNPAMPASGIRGESKSEILAGLGASPDFVAKWCSLDPSADASARAQRFLDATGLGYPVVLKPDVGERGKDVLVAQDASALESYIEAAQSKVILQEYVPGAEFGIFYVRNPELDRGQIFSITEKRMLKVVGDGKHSLERLILGDERAVCMAPLHLAKHAKRLGWTPQTGEVVPLTELGTHSRGALFLDGGDLHSHALEERFDAISRAYPGFFFGRYDVRAESVEALREGRGFKILELNGLTSEATHIYDPKNSLFEAYRVLFEQWRIAFEIGAAHQRAGVAPVSLKRLLVLLFSSTQLTAESIRAE